jgi:glycosyltransferase involved in cell wall biosynthesis
MKIINIVDNLDQVNMGIWKAAISTADILKRSYGHESFLISPPSPERSREDLHGLIHIPVNDLRSGKVKEIISEWKLDPSECIIATHGSWQYPSRWGYEFQRQGFKWVYTPHGMLEAEDRNRKWWKKILYFHLFEKRFIRKAALVRAVSSPESYNLRKYFNQVDLIPNGINIESASDRPKENIILFMARIHKKKGIIELINAWLKSKISKGDYHLMIAGPDHGALAEVERLIEKHGKKNNISYAGPVYGSDKAEALRKAKFYILPSYSEGFPTSVLEAMQAGCVPLITEGCNFPEALANHAAIKIEPDVKSIKDALDRIMHMQDDEISLLSQKAIRFVSENYSMEKIAGRQAAVFGELLLKSY